MEAVLFVLTKLYPFGRDEQYLANEQPYLSEKFDRIVFVPCEVFSPDQTRERRSIPSNAEVLLLNDKVAEVQTGSKHLFQLVRVAIREWLHVPDKAWFFKERKRYKSVLFHQSKCADVFNEILRTKFADSSHCFYAYWIHNSSIMLGLMKERRMIKEYVVRGHSIDLYDWDWASTRTAGLKVLPFHYFNIHSASWIFPISRHGEKFLHKKFPRHANKVKAFRLGVSPSAPNPYNEKAPFTIVTCGFTIFSKGIDKIPQILKHLDFPVRWVHFGGDGDASEFVNKAIRELPKYAKVELRGHTANELIRQFYVQETVHLFVAISEVEGIPVSIMEAISAGIPVLASNVYGVPEIANAETGFCVPFETPIAELAEMITSFSKDEGKQLELRASARKFYQREFSAEVNYRAFCEELSKHFH